MFFLVKVNEKKKLTKIFDEFEVIVILSITFKIISPLVESVPLDINLTSLIVVALT